MITTIRVNKEGLELFLGPLEVTVLVTMWKLKARGKPVTTQNVHSQLIKEGYDYAYQTIYTIIDRLVKKDLVIKKPRLKGSVFEPKAQDEKAFVKQAIFDLLCLLGIDYDNELETALAQYFAERIKNASRIV